MFVYIRGVGSKNIHFIHRGTWVRFLVRSCFFPYCRCNKNTNLYTVWRQNKQPIFSPQNPACNACRKHSAVMTVYCRAAIFFLTNSSNSFCSFVWHSMVSLWCHLRLFCLQCMHPKWQSLKRRQEQLVGSSDHQTSFQLVLWFGHTLLNCWAVFSPVFFLEDGQTQDAKDGYCNIRKYCLNTPSTYLLL